MNSAEQFTRQSRCPMYTGYLLAAAAVGQILTCCPLLHVITSLSLFYATTVLSNTGRKATKNYLKKRKIFPQSFQRPGLCAHLSAQISWMTQKVSSGGFSLAPGLLLRKKGGFLNLILNFCILLCRPPQTLGVQKWTDRETHPYLSLKLRPNDKTRQC